MSIKKHFVLLLFITAIFFLQAHGYAFSHSSYEPTGTLSGYVTDTLMNPLSGALVRVYFHETYEENYSDSSGYYQVTDIPLCYCLKNATCSKPGYLTEWVLLSIGENTTYDFTLAPLGSDPYPVLNGTLGNNGIYVSCVNVTFVNIQNIDALFYKLDDAEYTQYHEPFMVCENGVHALWWYWIYQGNFSEECFITLKIDRDLPTVHLSSQRISINKRKITGDAADETSGIHRVEFLVDGYHSYIDYDLPYEVVINGIGIHVVNATAFDLAGNSANSTIITSRSSQRRFFLLHPFLSWFVFIYEFVQRL